MSLTDTIQDEIQLWTAPENRGEVLEALAASAIALAICGGLSVVSALLREDFSPAWDAYVVDRIAAGDIGCRPVDGDTRFVYIGDVRAWLGNPYSARSPAGGDLSSKTRRALDRAHMECIKRQDEASFMSGEQSKATP